jgi:type II secretory pathway pseudopilin PulG
VLVVVVIVGILITFATLSISGRALSDRLETEARRLQQLCAMASEDAELHGIEIGLIHTDAGYSFVTTTPSGRWAPIPAGPLRPRELKPPIAIQLKVEGRSVPPTPLADLVAAAKAASAEAAKTAPDAADKTAKDQDKEKDKDKKDDPRALKPQALFLSSGETTALDIEISAPGVAETYRLEIDNLGRGSLNTLSRRR